MGQERKIKRDNILFLRLLVFPAAIACLAALLVRPQPVCATFHEQMAVSTQAISLGNAVTARPPGHMAIHYNPAGLSLLPEGKHLGVGLTIPVVEKTSRFTKDENFGGFLEGEYQEEDPIYAEGHTTEGTNSDGRMYVPLVDETIDFLAGPSLGASSRSPGSRWTFAIGNYAPFAVGLVHGDKDDPTRYGGKSVYWQHLVYAAPAASYEVTPDLSMGLSVGMGQTAMGAELDMRTPHDLLALSRILGDATEGMMIPPFTQLYYDEPFFGGGLSPYDKLATLQLDMRSDFSPNYNLGLLYEPWSWISLGAVYQSPIKVYLHGSYHIDYTEDWQNFVDWFGRGPLGTRRLSAMLDLPTSGVPSQSGVVTSEIEFPQRAQLGIKLQPFSFLRLMFDLKWADWSVLERDKYEFDQDIQLFRVAKFGGYAGGNRTLVIERQFEDTLDWAAGLELAVTDWLDLRLGYEWRESSVPDENYDLLMALPDLHSYGAGLGIHFANGVSIDIAGAYLVNESYEIKSGESQNLNSPDFANIVYNPYVGSDYEQETYTYMGSITTTMPFSVLGNMTRSITRFFNPLHWYDSRE